MLYPPNVLLSHGAGRGQLPPVSLALHLFLAGSFHDRAACESAGDIAWLGALGGGLVVRGAAGFFVRSFSTRTWSLSPSVAPDPDVRGASAAPAGWQRSNGCLPGGPRPGYGCYSGCTSTIADEPVSALGLLCCIGYRRAVSRRGLVERVNLFVVGAVPCVAEAGVGVAAAQWLPHFSSSSDFVSRPGPGYDLCRLLAAPLA